jgi:hypothetical protein
VCVCVCVCMCVRALDSRHLGGFVYDMCILCMDVTCGYDMYVCTNMYVCVCVLHVCMCVMVR